MVHLLEILGAELKRKAILQGCETVIVTEMNLSLHLSSPIGITFRKRLALLMTVVKN